MRRANRRRRFPGVGRPGAREPRRTGSGEQRAPALRVLGRPRRTVLGGFFTPVRCRDPQKRPGGDAGAGPGCPGAAGRPEAAALQVDFERGDAQGRRRVSASRLFEKGIESGGGGCRPGGRGSCRGCRQRAVPRCDHRHAWPGAGQDGSAPAGVGGMRGARRRQGKGLLPSTPSSSGSSNSSAFLHITGII